MAATVRSVFVPGSFPTVTYVERTTEGLEQKLRDALDTPGQVVSLAGPSKCGKTVLVEKVVGRDALITIHGAGISSAEDIWDRALDWMNAPVGSSRATTVGGKVQITGEAAGSGGIPGIAKLQGKVGAGTEFGADHERGKTFARRGLTQVSETIANSEYVILIDDFHYIPRETQLDVARALKEAVRLGIKIVTAEVPHRGDDVVRALPELRGRTFALDVAYWKPTELVQIAISGFDAMGVGIPTTALDQFAIESAGSPQLMQSICLQACFVLDIREQRSPFAALSLSTTDVQRVFEQTSATADFRSLLSVLDAGPRTRGTERKEYDFTDGTKGDVYRCVLKAIALDPPALSFDYDELVARSRRICDGPFPSGSSLIGTCSHMSKLAIERFPEERAIEWDESIPVLELPDPYFPFYLRWSGRLAEEHL